MNPNTQEIHGSDSKNFGTLKYNIANGSDDILLDDPDLNFFSNNVKKFRHSVCFTRGFSRKISNRLLFNSPP